MVYVGRHCGLASNDEPEQFHGVPRFDGLSACFNAARCMAAIVRGDDEELRFLAVDPHSYLLRPPDQAAQEALQLLRREVLQCPPGGNVPYAVLLSEWLQESGVVDILEEGHLPFVQSGGLSCQIGGLYSLYSS